MLMRTIVQLAILILTLTLTATPARAADKPLALHPDNSHYFLFRGKPTVLITSGEHYGAVLNRDFDYVPYLDELHARKFNLTRTFTGVYREVPGSFGIIDNTLAPAPDRFLCPWRAGATSSIWRNGTPTTSFACKTSSPGRQARHRRRAVAVLRHLR